MSEIDITCRICRGEATLAQPLIHPCKCRGSIKYIHQECLMEWLNHSNKNTKQCDICNTPYRFRTIYDPNMPRTMPLKDVWEKMMQSFGSWLQKNASIALYTICALQIPMFWKFIGRIFTYTVDGKLPSPQFNMVHALLYGHNVRSRSGTFLSGPDTSLYDKMEYVFLNTFISGVLYVFVFVVVVVVVFIEHEWVVREEGYTKLLLRQIGREPRTKLADLLNLLLQGDAENDSAREIMINRALEDLQHVPDVLRNEAELRRVLADRIEAPHVQQAHDDVVERRAEGDNVEDDDSPYADLATVDEAEADAENTINLAQDDEETAEELERRQNLVEDELAAADAANNNGDLLEIFGIRFNLITPIQLMLIADFIVVLFLFNAYLIPHMLGSFAITAVSYIVSDILHYLLQPLLRVIPFSALSSSCGLLIEQTKHHRMIGPIYFVVSKLVITPLIEFVTNIFSSQRTLPPSTMERIFLLSVGYGLLCASLHRFMVALVAGKKPVMGTSRQIYKFLFKIVATAKVFAIFTIEIVLFPVFCGFLLDFCIQPLFAKELVTYDNSEPHYHMLLTSAYPRITLPYIRAVIYWLWGTFYMFFIALYVGMIRNNIFRPGVLFFIKSPEDPNARLIHDAVVKPFFLQILRIFLSAKVYTAFIVFGIGGVTWGLRFFISPPSLKTPVLLPISFQGNFILSIVPIWVTAMFAIKMKPIIAKFCQIFWKRCFTVLCYKLRLSHFLLGVPIPQERGYVVYSNFIQAALKTSAPDYTQPLSYVDALQKFRADPSVHACFVPDGNFLRVPGTDDNSHKFLRSLFVPVSKTDQLLRPVEEVPVDEEADWWDEDIDYEDTYSVVYSPPNLKFRCVALVIIVCGFGALLLITLSLIALLTGRPIYRAGVILGNLIMGYLRPDYENQMSKINWALADIFSLVIGVNVELLALFYASYKIDEEDTRAFFADQQDRIALPVQNVGQILKDGVVFCLASALPYFVASYMHFVFLSAFEQYYFGVSLVGDADKFRVNFTWNGFLLHLALIPWSFLPVFNGFFNNFKEANASKSLQRTRAIEAAGCCGYIGLLRLYYYAEERSGVVLDQKDDVMMKLMALAMIVLTRSAFGAYSLFSGLHEQIKNEKYVRGTAVENLPMAADEY